MTQIQITTVRSVEFEPVEKIPRTESVDQSYKGRLYGLHEGAVPGVVVRVVMVGLVVGQVVGREVMW